MSVHHLTSKHRKTLFVATQGVKEYRATIPEYVNEHDLVLDIGCEWGTTTVLLAERAREVVGIDIGEEPLQRARERHPHLRFECLDAWDMDAVLKLGRPFTKVYMDISGLSGYNSLLDLISILNMYEACLRPEIIVVKSSALKSFAGRCRAWKMTPKQG
ncbi:MAG: hypothetical protein COZ06_04045 [Armatimonadetes bacterium CG_4_10_14_3_um_filter_66_18]|nr:class I SAM-dependent methyltransferase [Armatimonadota bacterium]OIO94550.1 MAG: hypothetical protein AUJ96_28505 [Armatimonadetes bacterium CG2_30_66_41]PIU92245.1 MAG: hypothetical protein COS65_18855 [Armatimonadetes bacterium CG06_land_8_20_14_3_00_66_21]PIW15914.1 MAG: hypothetical protein COW34_06255 [Armatimonadetes bacterium CG17_big_fil_post_rev_8_21_14_2_50_66_6]PIY51756.1 MAG: hypothetical protein COZ06_04045 [Armatimonadetes bacterium CG_4_10_14_3_um_filter_66_18]PJB67599.1 MAG